MRFKVVFHPAAERELDDIFHTIVLGAGPLVASNYTEGLLDFIESLADFPKRGTIREGRVDGLRIIGYRRRVSIGFVVSDDTVTVLGVFAKGRNVTPDLLADRL